MIERFGLTKRRGRFPSAAPLALLTVLLSLPAFARPTLAQKLSDAEATEIAVEAYLYAYPLVVMDVTRQVSTNCETASGAKMCAPINQFAHVPAFPDATFTDVVRPNADTLYSSLWFDVTREPQVIHVPDSGGRYYLLPMLDLWADVFASPGKRTTGTAEQTFAIVGPDWKGELPKGVDMVRSPTGLGWMIGRTQTNGKPDFGRVHAFQSGLEAIPLSAWGTDYMPPKGQVDPKVSSDPPVQQAAKMDAAAFFARFAELTHGAPPHANDNPIDRYAIGDRDALKLGKDGSLTVYIQRESPGKDKESNWLPAPKSGAFSMNLRLYWPKPAALDGTWKPPAVVKLAE